MLFHGFALNKKELGGYGCLYRYMVLQMNSFNLMKDDKLYGFFIICDNIIFEYILHILYWYVSWVVVRVVKVEGSIQSLPRFNLIPYAKIVPELFAAL